MSKVKLLSAAAVAALALPGTAEAAKKIYAADLDAGGRIAFDVVVKKKGKPKRITGIRADGLPLECELSVDQVGFFWFEDFSLKVVKRQASAEFRQAVHGNISTLDGRFKPKKTFKGTFEWNYHFLEDPAQSLPEEDCTTGPFSFKAKRGAPDVVVPPARRVGRRAG